MKITIIFLCITILSVLLTGCTVSNNPINVPSGNNPSPISGQVPRSMMNQAGFPRIDYDAAAARLNVSAGVLEDTLGVTGGQRPDFNAAAAKLNITPEQLRSALGFTGNFTRSGNFSRGNFTRRIMGGQ
jgi:hypothetical protein